MADQTRDNRIRRLYSILASAIFAVVAPGTVAGLIPWWLSGWRFQDTFFGYVAFRYVGAMLIVAGLPVLIDAFARFALEGLGSPAPVYPTRHLVVTGFYRYVRNPMYVAVASLIFGQSLLFGNRRVFEYGLFVCLGFHLFVLLYEEPTLRRTFGAEYESFCANVPRWIPRLTPWRAESII
jgi:protein-S-isoprenylcysteine O-methyltransferase Ste14